MKSWTFQAFLVSQQRGKVQEKEDICSPYYISVNSGVKTRNASNLSIYLSFVNSNSVLK